MNDSFEIELMKKIANQDAASLEELYDRYERAMFAFAYRMLNDRMTAEEAVQELFTRIWRSADRFDAFQGKLSTWMFTLLRNICIDLIRKKKSRTPEPEASVDELQILADTGQNTEQQVEWKFIGEEVRQALNELNPDQKQAVEAIYFEGLTQQEVAEKYSIPLGTVKSRVRLAMKQLNVKLAELGRREMRA